MLYNEMVIDHYLEDDFVVINQISLGLSYLLAN